MRKHRENIKEAQKQHKKHFDAAHQPPAYNVGDLVLVDDARRKHCKGDKLKPRWVGPHSIEEVRPTGTIKLKNCKALVNAMRIHHHQST